MTNAIGNIIYYIIIQSLHICFALVFRIESIPLLPHVFAVLMGMYSVIVAFVAVLWSDLLQTCLHHRLVHQGHPHSTSESEQSLLGCLIDCFPHALLPRQSYHSDCFDA
ncbi:hypothetical protein BDR26DRAFT_851034 [Obelidium mucronatum]|nr:hypothetical protein BDR26DRAFT_851034 [Obelidium mucronatum]